ncbi:MAG: SPOR domain-containing protein [Steroidobacteraceae bacterium]
MNTKRLTARDYKNNPRASFELGRWRDFGIGLGAGLLVAAVIYIGDHRTPTAGAEELKPTPRSETAAQAAKPAANGASTPSADAVPEQKYDFYDMLPNYEVVVPEKERDVKRPTTTAPIDQPGTYFLQAGSYRGQPDAERVRTQLEKQGIQATVQRVAVDADVWHRVRVGPIKDLTQLNRIRKQLQAADFDALVIRVSD